MEILNRLMLRDRSDESNEGFEGMAGSGELSALLSEPLC